MPDLSPLAPTHYPELPPIPGVRLAAVHCGIRYKSRKDFLLVELAEDTQVAGVFTTSRTASAPVLRSRQHLAGGVARGLLVNSGNSNAFTGQLGEQAVTQTLAAAARLLNCEAEELFVASTGVIGEPLPYEKILGGLPKAADQLSSAAWEEGARAIMTTDTFPKYATAKALIGGVEVTINGFAKGSGMIAPDMATMLGFFFTDADIPAPILQALLQEANWLTFNAVTVDGDTSTSDTCLLFATGQARHEQPVSAQQQLLDDFRRALHSVMHEMALQIVRDGEGAHKLIEITVEGAEDERAARTIAMSIANSPLVKTAIAGEDANWGRVVMAVGKAGEAADRDRLSIWFGDTLVAERGQVHPAYREAMGAQRVKGQHVKIRVDVGVGDGAYTAWTCDLTEAYIRINADYRS